MSGPSGGWSESPRRSCCFSPLDGASAARAYLEERDITPESVQGFRIGYSPEGWTWLIERARSAVRISLGEQTTDADVGEAIDAFRRVLARAA